jgi:hypothetical protein
MSKTKAKQKIAERKKMIAEANAKHDLQFGFNPIITNYATHVKGRSDISQKR